MATLKDWAYKNGFGSLYENYIKLGGNSYVVELFEVMHSWKIK